MVPAVYHIGPTNYFSGARDVLFISLAVFGTFFLLVAYDHFVLHHVYKYRLPVVAAISIAGILLIGGGSYYLARKDCADFDTLVLPGNGTVILKHSCRHTTIELKAEDIRSAQIVEKTLMFYGSYWGHVYVESLVIETADGRKFESESENREYEVSIKEINTAAEALRQYLLRYSGKSG